MTIIYHILSISLYKNNIKCCKCSSPASFNSFNKHNFFIQEDYQIMVQKSSSRSKANNKKEQKKKNNCVEI